VALGLTPLLLGRVELLAATSHNLEPARKFGSCPEHLTDAASIDFAGRSESGRGRLGLQ
jgi:hypothetical protein